MPAQPGIVLRSGPIPELEVLKDRYQAGVPLGPSGAEELRRGRPLGSTDSLGPARRVEPPVLRARGGDRKTDCPPTGTPCLARVEALDCPPIECQLEVVLSDRSAGGEPVQQAVEVAGQDHPPIGIHHQLAHAKSLRHALAASYLDVASRAATCCDALNRNWSELRPENAATASPTPTGDGPLLRRHAGASSKASFPFDARWRVHPQDLERAVQRAEQVWKVKNTIQEGGFAGGPWC